jgi:MarR family transcriptional regulator, transcriptional regulator for hemolysin
MSNSQPEESIGFLISDVSRLLRRNFDKRAQKIGLSRAQWQVLAWLKRNEGISQTQLADLLEMSPMTLVRLIDRLEMNGLVERRAHPTDRRIYQLFLAGHAHPSLDRLWSMGAETRGEALDGITPETEAAMLQALAKIRKNLIAADARVPVEPEPMDDIAEVAKAQRA